MSGSDKKIGRIFSESAFGVAGARYLTQGKNPIESISIENHRKPSTTSILLAETLPTLIQAFEPNAKEFSGLMKQYQSYHFTEVSPRQVALVTEITIS